MYGQTMQIRKLRQDTITTAEADEFARLRTVADPDRLRSDPPVSRQLAINDIMPSVATWQIDYWGLFDGDRMLAWALADGAVNAERSDIAEIGIFVDPGLSATSLSQQSTQSIADYAEVSTPDVRRLLFDHVDAIESARGRTRYWGWGLLDHQPTRSFWEDELGYALAYDERISRCVLDEVDGNLMQQWIDQAHERASGYHLIRERSPFSDQVIGLYAQGLEAMNDAPLDDLEAEDETFDVERARQIEFLHTSTDSTNQAIFAVETATGALAGFTAVRIPNAAPQQSYQNDTVTVDAHRNRGIGRWIKASMYQWLRDESPEVATLDTGNAESNAAMLAINEAMGFRDILHHGIWHKPKEK